MMEELIWKFLDNDCTQEEVEQVKKLIETDPDFNNLYLQLSELDKVLSESVHEVMSPAFRLKLEQKIISNSVKIHQYKISDILPKQWIAALSLAAVVVIVYVLNFNTGVSSVIPDMPLPDEKIMNMISLVTIGFIMLLLLDWALKTIHKKKVSFFMA
jgi:hypothetical protein